MTNTSTQLSRHPQADADTPMAESRATGQTVPTPTVVLVHGAFAGAEGWSGVIEMLEQRGYPVIGAANPLRGVRHDADYLASLLLSIEGPVVLVGHSYGGTVITNAVTGTVSNVRALVYVGAFSPDVGESVVSLAGLFPGSTLGENLAPPVALGDGAKDLYISQPRFHHQFAADLPEAQAHLMSIAQRPIAESAILEPSGEPAWKRIPSWHIYGTADRNIPAAAMKFMAQRASAKNTVELVGASHVPHISQAKAIADMIDEAARLG